MSKTYTQLIADPSWESDKSIAFDLNLNQERPVRIFVPRSQVIDIDGSGQFISDWIMDRKLDELITKGFDEDVIQSLLDDIAHGETYEEPEKRFSLNGIRDFFDMASEHLNTPKIMFYTDDGDVKLNRAGSRSKHFGKVFITNAEEWGSSDRKFYGSIDVDGLFTPSVDCTDAIQDLIKRFDDDPAGVASEEGRESGNCLFCCRALTTERSREVGYGPTCAKNYGLNY